MGAHWRMAVSHLSDRHSQLAADKAAAAAARLKQEQTLHELKVEHEKDMGVYAPKAALKAMGADKLRVSRVSSATHAGGRESSSGNAEDSPERYPAVSYFSRLREMSPATGAARPATSRDGHVARGMLYQRNAGPDEDVSRQEDYAGDASPVAWRREESEGRHVESERRRSRIEDAQRRLISPHTPALASLITACVEITSCLCESCFCREISSCCSCSCHVPNPSKSLTPDRLADKWRLLMANPPPVTYRPRLSAPDDQHPPSNCDHASPVLKEAFVVQQYCGIVLSVRSGLTGVLASINSICGTALTGKSVIVLKSGRRRVPILSTRQITVCPTMTNF